MVMHYRINNYGCLFHVVMINFDDGKSFLVYIVGFEAWLRAC